MSARFKSELDLPPGLRQQVREQLGHAPRGTPTPAPRKKFGNQVVEFEGERFGSKWELHRWRELLVMRNQGLIVDLQHHVPFALHVMTPLGDLVRIAEYEADFVYRRGEELVVEDTKSTPTQRDQLYRRTRTHFETEYALRVIEIHRAPRRGNDAK